MLNALHFLSKGLRPGLMLKSVVEMRMLALAGYMPDLVCCAECACYESDVMYFLPGSGRIFCGGCYRPGVKAAIPLGRGVLTALRHTIYADFEKLFSFQLPEEGLRQLARASEAYTLCRLERGFTTLDFYHSCTAQDGFQRTWEKEIPQRGSES